MSENLPQKYNKNFFSNLLLKIKSLFYRKNSNKDIVLNNEKHKKDDNKLTFFEEIRYEEKIRNTNYEKNKFMKYLKENPSLLEELPNDKLEIILKYYLDENKRKRNQYLFRLRKTN